MTAGEQALASQRKQGVLGSRAGGPSLVEKVGPHRAVVPYLRAPFPDARILLNESRASFVPHAGESPNALKRGQEPQIGGPLPGVSLLMTLAKSLWPTAKALQASVASA